MQQRGQENKKMIFLEQLRRIRRKLRDPDGDIWSRDFIINLFNDVQKDIQTKTRYLEDVQVLRLPSFYHASYLHEWEWAFLPDSQYYRALRYFEQDSTAYTSRWEAQEIFGIASDVSDEGAHFTQPWEAWSGLTVGETVEIKFPPNFHTTKLLAYDQVPIDYLSKKHITERDPSYIIREGDTYAYYREDELSNSFIPYPRPSTVVWNDVQGDQDPDWLYTYDWEADSTQVVQLAGTGERWLFEDATNNREHTYIWEDNMGADQDYGLRGMYLFELDYLPPGNRGTVQYVSGDTTTGVGVINSYTAGLFSQETGLAVEVLDDHDNFLLIYDVTPEDIAEDTDESDFPDFLQKYIEYGVISRAYGANTDGKIQSLADYWNLRYEAGLVFIKRYMSNRKVDRDYRLTINHGRTRIKRHPRLPDTYPTVG